MKKIKLNLKENEENNRNGLPLFLIMENYQKIELNEKSHRILTRDSVTIQRRQYMIVKKKQKKLQQTNLCMTAFIAVQSIGLQNF